MAIDSWKNAQDIDHQRNARKNHCELERLLSKNQKIVHAAEDV